MAALSWQSVVACAGSLDLALASRRRRHTHAHPAPTATSVVPPSSTSHTTVVKAPIGGLERHPSRVSCQRR